MGKREGERERKSERKRERERERESKKCTVDYIVQTNICMSRRPHTVKNVFICTLYLRDVMSCIASRAVSVTTNVPTRPGNVIGPIASHVLIFFGVAYFPLFPFGAELRSPIIRRRECT